jgi:hypothetical protein
MRSKQVWPPRSFSSPGRCEGLAPGNHCIFSLAHPAPDVQTTHTLATPCCEALRRAAAGCWGCHQRCKQAAVAGEGLWHAPGVFSGLRSRGVIALFPTTE